MTHQENPKNKYVELARHIVLKNIDKNKDSVFLFGSRVYEECPHNSDIDIGIIGEQPLGKVYYKLLDALHDSSIPYHVDIVDFFITDNSFKKKVLEGKFIIWNQGKYFKQNGLPTNKQ